MIVCPRCGNDDLAQLFESDRELKMAILHTRCLECDWGEEEIVWNEKEALRDYGN